VTYGGSTFVAQCDNSDPIGGDPPSKAWRLAVQRGRLRDDLASDYLRQLNRQQEAALQQYGLDGGEVVDEPVTLEGPTRTCASTSTSPARPTIRGCRHSSLPLANTASAISGGHWRRARWSWWATPSRRWR
jgi:hypothetical protein